MVPEKSDPVKTIQHIRKPILRWLLITSLSRYNDNQVVATPHEMSTKVNFDLALSHHLNHQWLIGISPKPQNKARFMEPTVNHGSKRLSIFRRLSMHGISFIKIRRDPYTGKSTCWYWDRGQCLYYGQNPSKIIHRAWQSDRRVMCIVEGFNE